MWSLYSFEVVVKCKTIRVLDCVKDFNLNERSQCGGIVVTAAQDCMTGCGRNW